MGTYIGVKIIKAEPITVYGKEGYMVVDPDEQEDFVLKGEFESKYFPIKQENRISAEDIDNFLNMSEISFYQGDPKTTVVRVLTPTGFVSWGFASCVSPENYDDEIGTKIALNRIKNKIWELLGFTLQWGAYGLNNINKTAK